MSAVAEKFIPCVGLAALIDGTRSAIMTGGFSVPVETDDMTNNAGYGFYEDVKTISKATLKLSVAATTTPTGLKSGNIYPVLINCTALPTVTAGIMADPTPTVAGAPALAGNFRLTMDDAPNLDVKAGVKYSFTATSQGSFAYVI